MSQTFSFKGQKVCGRADFNLPVTIVDDADIVVAATTWCVQDFLESVSNVRKRELQGIVFEKSPCIIVVKGNQLLLNGQEVIRICTSKRTNVFKMVYAETSDYVLHFCKDITVVTNN